MEYLGILAVYLALCWTGCSVPPDWSVCECNWLDNTWFHHITVLHSYSGDDFVNYLVNPAHPLHAWVLKQECPQQVCDIVVYGAPMHRFRHSCIILKVRYIHLTLRV